VTAARAKSLKSCNVSGLLVRVNAHNGAIAEHNPLPAVLGKELRDCGAKASRLVRNARENRVAIQNRGPIRVHDEQSIPRRYRASSFRRSSPDLLGHFAGTRRAVPNDWSLRRAIGAAGRFNRQTRLRRFLHRRAVAAALEASISD
jgi:hypothetical protein